MPVILFALFFLAFSPTIRCLPLTDFFPYGPTANDSTMPPTLDDFIGPISLPYILPFFDTNHQAIYLGNNGLFSFGAGIAQFVPDSFPLDDGRQIIGGFWGDADTLGQSETIDGVYNKVYYQVHTNSSSTAFNKASSYVQNYFPKERPFQPKMIITATWYRVGTYPMRTDSLNTFQIVLATDEFRSFTFFLYHDIQWTYTNSTNTDIFNYAQAGFDAGDGVNFKMLPHSRTPDIYKLVNESNVNVPGLFVFRIDTFDIESGGCEGNTSDAETKYSYSPIRGIQLGGTSINIQGPCFSTTDSVKCQFGSYGTVNGLILNRFLARCIAPMAEHAEAINFSISLDNGATYRLLGQYTYMAPTMNYIADAQIRNTSNLPLGSLISWKSSITVDWFLSSSTYDSLPPNSSLDIEYVEIDDEINLASINKDAPLKTRQIIPIATGIIPTAGYQSIAIDLTQARKARTKSATTPLALGFLRLTVPSIVSLTTNIFIWKAELPDMSCSKWISMQPDPTSWNEGLLPCPSTRTQAIVAGCCYIVDPACKLGSRCWLHEGRMELQEESAVECYRSKGTNVQGGGGECCYDKSGHLITRGTGAGSDDRYHSSNYILKHFLGDILPLVSCCKLSQDQEMCDNYFRYRPPRRGSNINPQNGGVWGDPHYQTLDGLSYTFNGYGEYVYLAILEENTVAPQAFPDAFDPNLNYAFMSQVRTVPLAGPGSQVTVTKAFAAQSNDPNSEPIRFIVSRRQHLQVYRGKDLLDLEPSVDSMNSNESVILTFPDVTIEKEPNNGSITTTWLIGVSVKIASIMMVSPSSALVLSISVSISSTFKNRTYGLLGSFDGNDDNDLRNKQGEIIPSTSTTEQIHRRFGTTWAIDPVKSILLYEHNETSIFYHQQNMAYNPLFSLPLTSNTTLARQVCQIDPGSDMVAWTTAQRTCFFDLSVTNDQTFARSSFVAGQELEEIRELLRNPPEFNSSLPFELNFTKGSLVSIHFQATSEFSRVIHYELEKSPSGSTLDKTNGIFQWQVPETFAESRSVIRVKAQDDKYNLSSTHEVLLYEKKVLVGTVPSMTACLHSVCFMLILSIINCGRY